MLHDSLKQALNGIQQKELMSIFNSKWLSSFYYWQNSLSKWVKKDKNQFLNSINTNQSQILSQKTKKYLLNKKNKIKSVTLNVLFDFRSSQQPDKDRGHMKYSVQRYKFILRELEKMQCDIITLNEVTRPFIKMIEQQKWVRRDYKISTCHDSPYDFDGLRCFGNIILTKMQPLALHVYKVQNLPRAIPIAFFLIESKSSQKQFSQLSKTQIVTFSSIHLTAYDINFGRREKQLTEIKKYLDKYNFCRTHVLQGDMNFHSEKQNVNAQKNGLLDCWLQVNQNNLQLNPGYTFDSEKNFFIKELYWGFEKRRMRLDRIFISSHNENVLKPKQMKVIFDKPIYENLAQDPSINIFKSVVTFLGDKGKWNIFRQKEKYLFSSDHFGIECLFQVL